MKSPLQALTRLGVVPPVTFPTDSRYYGSSTLTHVTPTGETVTYLARRIVPQPGAPNFSTVAQHTVRQGDRLDLIAAKYLDDPLILWLICDANDPLPQSATLCTLPNLARDNFPIRPRSYDAREIKQARHPELRHRSNRER